MKARPGASPSAAEPPLGRVLRVCGHPRRRAPDGRARLMGRLSRVGLPAASVRAGHTPCEPAENRDGFSVIFPFGATDPRLGFWWERGRVLPLPMSCSRGSPLATALPLAGPTTQQASPSTGSRPKAGFSVWFLGRCFWVHRGIPGAWGCLCAGRSQLGRKGRGSHPTDCVPTCAGGGPRQAPGSTGLGCRSEGPPRRTRQAPGRSRGCCL